MERRREREQQGRLHATPAPDHDRHEAPEALAEIGQVERADVIVAMICSWTGEDQRQRREHERQRQDARRAGRNGPRPAVAEHATSASQMITIARNEPIGSSEIMRMNAIVRMNFTRASARWTGLSRST